MAKKRKGGKAGVKEVSMRRRMLFCFFLVCLAFLVLAARIGYIQIIKGEEYSAMATERQTRDVPLSAERGIIFDSNMKALAINQPKYTVWVRPSTVAEAEAEDKGYTQAMASALAGIFTDKTEEEIYSTITADTKSVVKLEKYADEDQVEAVRHAMSKDGGETVTGITVAETVKRYYPMGAFASHLIGSTNDDNNGMSGLELYYDQYLTGTEGRWIKSSDPKGRKLTNGIEKYYAAEDGYSIVLTIDEVIQHYVEQAISNVYYNTAALNVMAIAMNPKTGEVLAMASYPDYDLNDPRTPLLEYEQNYLATLSDEEKVEYWNKMWRNPLINDTYEPGSPFKLLTTAMALEENLTNLNDGFYCSSAGITIYDRTLKCWRYYNAHGSETLMKGVENSCNPVFITLSQRLGLEKFYTYLDAYGFMDGTGIDYPGEAETIIQSKKNAGPVGLATMSYGQGIACTPIQLITALCAAGNDGKMMKPYLVKALADSNGNIKETIEPEVVRQVISEQTADDICTMMEGVVSEGTGMAAYIPGYRIGGKTGTAQKAVNGKYTDDTMSSFFAMAPMDDPQFALLLVVDSPQGVHYGSQTAGPGVYEILSNTLRYLNIEPIYSDGEQTSLNNQMVTVPDLTGYNYYQACNILSNLGLKYISCPEFTEDFNVVDQYPKPGQQLAVGNSVCLYKE